MLSSAERLDLLVSFRLLDAVIDDMFDRSSENITWY
jgi:hypothetical protein